MKNLKWYEEEHEEMFDELLDIADYIAYNNTDFICTTCLTTIDKLKDLIYRFYGFEKYMYFSEVIDSIMEDTENE